MVDLDRIPPKIAAFVDAVNAQDMAGIVECFHPDARLTSEDDDPQLFLCLRVS